MYDFDGQELTLELTRSGLISRFNTEVEAGTDGRIYFTNGLVLDGTDLLAEGTFSTGLFDIFTLVEPVPDLGLTYFVGGQTFQNSNAFLNVFDNETFLMIDSIPLTGVSVDDTRGELLIAGENRLALISQASGFGPRTMTFISNIPVSVSETVPEPNSLAVLAFVSSIGVLRRRKRA